MRTITPSIVVYSLKYDHRECCYVQGNREMDSARGAEAIYCAKPSAAVVIMKFALYRYLNGYSLELALLACPAYTANL